MAKFLCGVLCGAIAFASLFWGFALWNHPRRRLVNDTLTVYLGELGTGTAASESNNADGFPMRVLVTGLEPDGTVAFEGRRIVSTSGGDCWTRSMRGKIDSADIHPGGIVFSSQVFDLEVKKIEAHPRATD
jgi:hypothetical protein